MSKTKTEPKRKRAAKKKPLPKKGDYIAAQMEKGRSVAQATASWDLMRAMRQAHARIKRRKARRKYHEREAGWQAAYNALIGVNRRSAARLNKSAVEAALKKHYAALGLAKQMPPIAWLGGPSELVLGPTSRKWVSAFGRKGGRRVWIDDLCLAIWEASFPEFQEPAPVNTENVQIRRRPRGRRFRFVARRIGQLQGARRRSWGSRILFCFAVRDGGAGSVRSPLVAAAKAGLLCFVPRNDVILALARPALVTERTRRDGLRLHCEDGPAIQWANGEGFYVWHGVPVPEHVIMRPKTITVEEIESEPNAERRRVLMQRFGPDRYLTESGARKLQEDECGVLWAKAQFNDEALVMVEVINSTPEPDGTIKKYWLRVPPDTTTARQGVAWTFEMTAEEYQPSVQT